MANKIYTIRSRAHNSAIKSGNADRILELWDEMVEKRGTDRNLKITDSNGNEVNIKDLNTVEEEERVIEEVVNNDNVVWPWDPENEL